MEKINNADIELAIILWTGWKKASYPLHDDKLVIEKFGAKAGAILLEKIKQLENDFYKSEARFIASNLAEMETISSEHFKKLYPELSPEIAKAFAWCYTYDYK